MTFPRIREITWSHIKDSKDVRVIMCEAATLMQDRFEYLAKYRRALPEEDFEVAMKAYEWPKKFVSIMKEAATKATSGMKTFNHLHVLPPLPADDL